MKRRKNLLIIGLTALGALGLVAAYAAFLIIDDPPPDETGLLLARLPVADADNGFLLVAFDEGSIPEDPILAKNGPVLELSARDAKGGLGAAAPWDAETARQLVEKHAAQLAALDACLERRQFVMPEDVSQDGAVSHRRAWQRLVNLLSARIRLRLADGDLRGAFDDALRQARFGRRAMASQASLIGLMTGDWMRSLGLRNLRALAGRQEIGSGEARRLLDAMAGLDTTPEIVADTIRGDYRAFKTTVEEIRDGKHDGAGLGPLDSLRKRLFFNCNATKRLAIESLRPLIESAGKVYKDRVQPGGEGAADGASSDAGRSGSAKISLPLKNGLGRKLCGLWLSEDALSRYHAVTVDTEFQLRAIRILIALRVCQGERGRLPERLDELVPEYLPAVPRDPFDGEPIRYSRERKLLWSVGVDLIDRGGFSPGGRKVSEDDAREPTCGIAF